MSVLILNIFVYLSESTTILSKVKVILVGQYIQLIIFCFWTLIASALVDSVVNARRTNALTASIVEPPNKQRQEKTK